MSAPFYRYALLILLLFPSLLRAQTYHRDSSFGANGITVPTVYGQFLYSHQVKKVLVQPDGKIILVGSVSGQSPLEMIRLNANGTLDASFGTNGYFLGNAFGLSYFLIDAALSPTGKIVIVGTTSTPGGTSSFVGRVNANGSVDNTFGSSGMVTLSSGTISSIGSVMFQADGKMLLGGAKFVIGQVNLFQIYRLNADGSADVSFGTAGRIESTFPQLSAASTTGANLAVQTDGKIVMATYVSIYPSTSTAATLALARFKVNGEPDSSFGQYGLKLHLIDSTSITPSSVKIHDATGEIYVMGSANLTFSSTPNEARPFIAKFNSGGSAVTVFGTNGRVILTNPVFTQQLGTRIYAYTILRQSDGKFIIAGPSDSTSTAHTRVVRLTTTGALDNTFSAGGVLDLPRGIRDMNITGALQPDGDILLGGFTFNKAKSNPSTLDSSNMYCFRITNRVTNTNPTEGIRNTANATGSLQVYPNPASGGHFYLAYEGIAANENLKLELLDITGRAVSAQTYSVGNTKGQVEFATAQALSAGTYLLKVSGKNGSYPVVKVMVD